MFKKTVFAQLQESFPNKMFELSSMQEIWWPDENIKPFRQSLENHRKHHVD